MLYVGLSAPQSVVAIDPKGGKIVREVVLDSEEIASTKEFVTVRLDARGKRLAIAQGSDESVSILSVPDLRIEREIGLEGEAIRDALFDPKDRYLYVLGRTVHVYDIAGQRELRAFGDIEPMAIATDSEGRWLAVAGTEKFENGPASVVAIYDAATLKEVAREPLQTDRRIEAMLFAAANQTLVVLAKDWFAEKPVASKKAPELTAGEGSMRMNFKFGDFVNSERICLPDVAGPQVGALGADGRTLIFAEKRCNASGGMTASPRTVATASLYATDAFAIAYDTNNDVVYATDPSGYLTVYQTPRPERPAGSR